MSIWARIQKVFHFLPQLNLYGTNMNTMNAYYHQPGLARYALQNNEVLCIFFDGHYDCSVTEAYASDNSSNNDILINY
jgi:hypothetical protein